MWGENMTLPFKNDTRTIIKKIAMAQLKHDKLQKRLTIFAIALATVLMSVVLLSISSIAAVNANGSNALTGSWHTMVSDITLEQYHSIRQDERVETVGLSVAMGSSSNDDKRVNLSYADGEALTLNGLSVSDGTMPKQENEILIEKNYLESINIKAKIGDFISLDCVNADGTTTKKDFIISGYLKTTASGTNRTLYAAIVSEKYFETNNGWSDFTPTIMFRINDGSSLDTENMLKTAIDIIEHVGIEKTPTINEVQESLR